MMMRLYPDGFIELCSKDGRVVDRFKLADETTQAQRDRFLEDMQRRGWVLAPEKALS